MSQILEEASRILHLIFPRPEDRTIHSHHTALYYAIPLSLIIIMGGLARRRNTWALRLAIFLFAALSVLYGGFGFISLDPDSVGDMTGQASYALQALYKIIDFTVSPDPMMKLADVESSSSHSNQITAVAKASLATHSWKLPRSLLQAIYSFVYDGIGISCSFRGDGWKFGAASHIHIPHEPRNCNSRIAFLSQTLRNIILRYIAIDVGSYILKSIPGLGTPVGGSIFVFGRNMLERYAISTGICILSGMMLILLMDETYDVLTFLAVAVFQSDPKGWPPFSDSPWLSTSLHDFWGRRWHQTLRRPFLLLGGDPFASTYRSLFDRSRPGLKPVGEAKSKPRNQGAIAFGTFLVSGLHHTLPAYATLRGELIGRACVVFFIAQSGGLMLEREWKRRTGKCVCGFGGWLWTALWMAIVGQAFINEYHKQGILGGHLIPPESSLVHRVYLPLLNIVVDRLQK